MSNYKTKLHDIKAFAFDVDGVLTDGTFISTADGDLLRSFNAKDGFALRMCKSKGYPIAIITGGVSESIKKRMTALGIDEDNIFEKARNKVHCFMQFCKKYGFSPKEVAFAGDDLPDIEVLKLCGLSVCPADAVAEVKDVCDFVSMYEGGKGCAREIIEQTLKVQDKWSFEVDTYCHLWS